VAGDEGRAGNREAVAFSLGYSRIYIKIVNRGAPKEKTAERKRGRGNVDS